MILNTVKQGIMANFLVKSSQMSAKYRKKSVYDK